VWRLACVAFLATSPVFGQTPAEYAGAGLSLRFAETTATRGATTGLPVAFQPGVQSAATGAALAERLARLEAR
jgi:hypothetical protein